MPEGIEVEYYRRASERAVGRTVAEVIANDSLFTKEGTTSEALEAALTGATVTATDRVGKLGLLRFDSGDVLGLRYGMTGRILVDGRGPIEYLQYTSPNTKPEWDRFSLVFADGGTLVIRDPRRLGGVILNPDPSVLGPDLYEVSRDHLVERVAVGSASIKSRLLDQARIAGIGNLIVDELLWRAHIAPDRRAETLSKPEITVLHQTLTSLVPELTAGGGSHTGRLQDHRVAGGLCPDCGDPLTRSKVGGRTTYWCTSQQL